MDDAYEIIDAGSSSATFMSGLCWVTTTEESVAWGPPARPWIALAITASIPVGFLSLLAVAIGWFAKSTGAFSVMQVVIVASAVNICCLFIVVMRALAARNAPVILRAYHHDPVIEVHGRQYTELVREASAFVSTMYWIEGGSEKIRRMPILLRLSLASRGDAPLYVVVVDNAWPATARKIAREAGLRHLSVRVGPAPSQREAIRRAVERTELVLASQVPRP